MKEENFHSTGNPDSSVEVYVVESTQDFELLREEWRDLYRNSPTVTPFQSWAWLYSWWESYGEDYGLRLLVVRSNGGLLVGIIPLMVEQRYGFSRLLFLGTGLTDYLDVIARSKWEKKVVETGTYALRHMIFWTVADLQQVRPDAIVWMMFQRWSGLKTAILSGDCSLVEAKSWDTLLNSRSRNLRSTARRSVRRAEKEGISTSIVDASDAERAARTLVALHRESWQGRNIGPEHLGERFESVIVAAVRRMSLEGIGGVSEFWQDGEVVISDFFISGPDYVGTYVLGASQEALQRYQWSSLYIWDAVNLARKTGKTNVDLLRGEELYKARWRGKTVPIHRLIFSYKPLVGALYGGFHVLRERIKQYTRSDTSPRWLKVAAAKLRVVRFKVG